MSSPRVIKPGEGARSRWEINGYSSKATPQINADNWTSSLKQEMQHQFRWAGLFDAEREEAKAAPAPPSEDFETRSKKFEVERWNFKRQKARAVNRAAKQKEDGKDGGAAAPAAPAASPEKKATLTGAKPVVMEDSGRIKAHHPPHDDRWQDQESKRTKPAIPGLDLNGLQPRPPREPRAQPTPPGQPRTTPAFRKKRKPRGRSSLAHAHTRTLRYTLSSDRKHCEPQP